MQLKYTYFCCVVKNDKMIIHNSLGPWMGKTMKLLEHKVEEIMAENSIDLNRMQFIVLRYIGDSDGLSQNDLAFFANRDKSTLTRMMNTLIKKGYIHREVCEKDKRRKLVTLTVQGKEIINKAIPHFKKLVQLMEEGISKEEKETTIKVLKKIQSNIAVGEPSPFFKNKL